MKFANSCTKKPLPALADGERFGEELVSLEGMAIF
jgi:hypothetical protein